MEQRKHLLTWLFFHLIHYRLVDFDWIDAGQWCRHQWHFTIAKLVLQASHLGLEELLTFILLLSALFNHGLQDFWVHTPALRLLVPPGLPVNEKDLVGFI